MADVTVRGLSTSRLLRIGFTVLKHLVRLHHVLFSFLPRESAQASDEILIKVAQFTYSSLRPLTSMSGSRRAKGFTSVSVFRLAKLWFTKRCVDSSDRTAYITSSSLALGSKRQYSLAISGAGILLHSGRRPASMSSMHRVLG